MGRPTAESLPQVAEPWHKAHRTQNVRDTGLTTVKFKCSTQSSLDMGQLRPGKTSDIFISITSTFIHTYELPMCLVLHAARAPLNHTLREEHPDVIPILQVKT